jgi:Rieske Fe-S protein
VRDIDLRVWLVKFESGEILALSQKDPHLGCTVPWRADFQFKGYKGWFRNPCHGETYDLTGYCYAGPCPRGLDRYETQVADGKVQVRVGNGTLIQGPPVAYSGDGTWLREPVVPGHLSDPLVNAGLLSDLQAGVPKHFEEGFYVVQLDQGGIRALSDVDVHAVQVRWPTNCFRIEWRDSMHFDGRDGWFRGPCSGSTFDLDGTRVSGPAPDDMRNYDMSVEDSGEIRVNTAKICNHVGTIGCSD